MHELSICHEVARLALRHAEGRPVRSVQVRVGALRQIVPESLTFCWPLVCRDPLLDGSALDLELIPAVVECSDCGERSTLTAFILCCPACGSGLVAVLSGEEFMITSIDVAPGVPGPNPTAEE